MHLQLGPFRMLRALIFSKPYKVILTFLAWYWNMFWAYYKMSKLSRVESPHVFYFKTSIKILICFIWLIELISCAVTSTLLTFYSCMMWSLEYFHNCNFISYNMVLLIPFYRNWKSCSAQICCGTTTLLQLLIVALLMEKI